jgi:hypothetical protein
MAAQKGVINYAPTFPHDTGNVGFRRLLPRPAVRPSIAFLIRVHFIITSIAKRRRLGWGPVLWTFQQTISTRSEKKISG